MDQINSRISLRIPIKENRLINQRLPLGGSTLLRAGPKLGYFI